VRTALKKYAGATGSTAITQVAVVTFETVVMVWAAQFDSVVPPAKSAVEPYVKATVPPAAAGVMVAVSVMLVFQVVVVAAVAGEAVSPTFIAVVVAVSAWALGTAAIMNKNRIARPPQLLRMLVRALPASVRIVVGDTDCISNISSPLRKVICRQFGGAH
jgi:hypothetical protein